MSITTVFSLFGGLGLFLYGMTLMSNSLEKAAGARLRSILQVFTKNRFIGLLVGLVFTAIIQSSNATTIMVVGFVNSGMMTLMQATGVILGANIGTTITGQLIAFNLSDIAPLIVIIGVVMGMFFKTPWVKKTGDVITGFGILFLGLSIMKDSMAYIQEEPAVMEFLGSLSSPFLAILVGFLITSILQSSSATVGIILLMVAQGLLDLSICPFIILGCNIGACVSALAVSLSGGKDAKRAALIHFLFNLIGSAIMFIILMLAEEPLLQGLLLISGYDLGRAVANAHSLMKIFEVIILFPFMGWIVKLTYVIVPGNDKEQQQETEFPLYYISDDIISPTTAVYNVTGEIENMGKQIIENVQASIDALITPDEEKIKEVKHRNEYIAFLNKKITDYMLRAVKEQMPLADRDTLSSLFHVTNDMERMSDLIGEFANSAENCLETSVSFSEKAQKQLQDMTADVVDILQYSLEIFTSRNPQHMRKVLMLESKIDEEEKHLQRSHVKRLIKNKCTPEAGVIFTDTITDLEHISDHATNVAFALMNPEEYANGEEDDEEE